MSFPSFKPYTDELIVKGAGWKCWSPCCVLHSAFLVRTGILKTGQDDTSETVSGHHTAIHTNIHSFSPLQLQRAQWGSWCHSSEKLGLISLQAKWDFHFKFSGRWGLWVKSPSTKTGGVCVICRQTPPTLCRPPVQKAQKMFDISTNNNSECSGCD